MNILFMKPIFSTPMPCSPVTLPPQARHSSRISLLAASTRWTCCGVALVEQQNRMNVAVAGVKDVDDADVVLAADFDDLAQNVRQLRARHDAVLRAIAGAEPADRAEGLLAAFPELEPLLFIAGEANFASAAALANLDDLVALLVEAGFQAIDFDQQNRLGVERKAELKRRLDRDQNSLVHHFQAAGTIPAPMISLIACRGVVDRFEHAEHRAVRLADCASAAPRPW